MKKKIIGLTIFGVLLMVAGGVGSLVYYPKANKQVKFNVQEKYQVKQASSSKTLELSLNGDIHYNIEQSTDDYFYLNGETLSLSGKKDISWKTKEEAEKMLIDVTYSESGKKENPVNFNIWGGHYQATTISIPKSYETITIVAQSNAVSVSDLATETLNLTNTNYRSSLKKISLSSLTVTSERGSIELEDIDATKKITVKSKSGDISLDNLRAKELATDSNDSNLSLSNIIAETTLTSLYGDLNLYNIVGKNQTTNKNGTIYLHQSKPTDDINLTTINGDITVSLGMLPTNIELLAESKTGDINLFEKNKTSFKKGSAGPKIKLSSATGDIDVYEEEDYDEDFDDDYLDSDY